MKQLFIWRSHTIGDLSQEFYKAAVKLWVAERNSLSMIQAWTSYILRTICSPLSVLILHTKLEEIISINQRIAVFHQMFQGFKSYCNKELNTVVVQRQIFCCNIVNFVNAVFLKDSHCNSARHVKCYRSSVISACGYKIFFIIIQDKLIILLLRVPHCTSSSTVVLTDSSL